AAVGCTAAGRTANANMRISTQVARASLVPVAGDLTAVGGAIGLWTSVLDMVWSFLVLRLGD
ncbi:hypothetical protein, partial [Streptomyces sp. NPDC092370]|uniref:hypothetical protein n=1 Tax=Streptomyces sp. NPDC092370 TaxID=3366016 RepID=UPI0038223A5A